MATLKSLQFTSARLCVVGNINRDLKTAPFQGGAFLLGDGETSVRAIQETIGGGGANSAAIAAGLGGRVSFVGQVGNDALGRTLERALRRSGVRCHLHRHARAATGSTINLVFESGHRHFLSCHPNNAALAFPHLDLSPLARADHLLRADIWFSEPMLYGGNEKLFRLARRKGVPISLDLNWDPCWGRVGRAEIKRRKTAVRRLLPAVALAHGNVRELNEFTESTDLATSLRRLTTWGVAAVVVHLGSDGAGYYRGGEWTVEKPCFVKHPRLATGTGDVLSACLMLLHQRADLSIRDKLRLANRTVARFMEGKLKLIPELSDPTLRRRGGADEWIGG